MHDLPVHIGQPVVPALALVGQLLVVDTQHMQAGGVKVMNVHRIFHDAETKFICGSILDAFLQSAPGHPDGKAFLVVVASGSCLGARSGVVFLDHGGASEFSAPNDKGVLEESALLQVGDKAGAGLVHALGLSGEGGIDVLVVIPAFVENLDEAHAPLDQPASEKAVLGEGSSHTVFGESVEFQNVLGFALHFRKFRNGCLHAVGQFVLRDAGLDFGIVVAIEGQGVELAHGVDHILALGRSDPIRVVEVEEGF